MLPNIIMSWSGGKDSSLSVYRLLQNKHNVVGLLSVINDQDKVAMHNVHYDLLKQQSVSIDLPLHIIYYKDKKSYEEQMFYFLKTQRRNGVQHIAFGDIFLSNVRKYREEKLKEVGMEGLFPLWEQDSQKLMEEFIGLGFKSIINTFNKNLIKKNILEKIIDTHFLKSLPSKVDVCGENGEYHSFTYDGPIFKFPISYKTINHRLENEMSTCDIISQHQR